MPEHMTDQEKMLLELFGSASPLEGSAIDAVRQREAMARAPAPDPKDLERRAELRRSMDAVRQREAKVDPRRRKRARELALKQVQDMLSGSDQLAQLLGK